MQNNNNATTDPYNGNQHFQQFQHYQPHSAMYQTLVDYQSFNNLNSTQQFVHSNASDDGSQSTTSRIDSANNNSSLSNDNSNTNDGAGIGSHTSMSNYNLKGPTDESNSLLSGRVSPSNSKFKMSGGGSLNLINSHANMSQNKSSPGSQQVFFTEGFKNEPSSPEQQFPNFSSQPNQQQSQLGSPGLTYTGYNSQMNFNCGLQQQTTG